MPSFFSEHDDLILIPRCVMLMIDPSGRKVTTLTVIRVTDDGIFIPLHRSPNREYNFIELRLELDITGRKTSLSSSIIEFCYCFI